MISHHHRCVFVHIPKTGGQSVERVFLELLGLDWSTRAPLLLQPNDHPALGPPKLAHLLASEYVALKYLPRELYESYFTFAFVRDPWARAVSFYKYLGFEWECSFPDFVRSRLGGSLWRDKHWFIRPQIDFLVDPASGERIVDFVGRLERMQEDFDVVCEKLGLGRLEVPHTNSSRRGKGRLVSLTRVRQAWWDVGKGRIQRVPRRLAGRPHPRHKEWRAYYDAETAKTVGAIYAADVEAFGYAPPE